MQTLIKQSVFTSLESTSTLASSLAYTTARYIATDLKEAIRQKIPEQQARLKKLKSEHGDAVLGDITVNMVTGGMRGMLGLLWETSLLDPEEGIRFRGYTIPELQAKLPTAIKGGEPMPEGLLWLLLTGDLPTQEQANSVTRELVDRSKLPDHVVKILQNLPEGTHPMTQFSIGVLAMQSGSHFAKYYQQGLHRSGYWEPVYEDTMDLIARLPAVAATVYRGTYKGGNYIESDPKLDWAANLAHMMGFDNQEALELMRMYQTIHADHEGGNVSAHTCNVVGSALADPYLSFSAGMNGLAGPLHGLANQEVLRWLKELQSKIGECPSKEEIEAYVKQTLASGKVVPGYGHAVLRVTDPRYSCQRVFAEKYLPEDPMFKLVKNVYEVVPPILVATGKVKNPWPNVDAHSGVLLQYYGIVEENFYTVLFGVSRGIGVLSQGVWSRALGLPIERPKSITMTDLFKKLGKA
eukprot:TRINITY_DN4506_c0_g1_i1.p1 TRINITY_DN4506_c0_g1~~TRINITY_DN4506_c0_g1_i1.p1  ORF type:complete len:480 (+),score=59.62 TRINITY_DN4506_c0_g1_i1:43-1440(+)